MTFRKIVSVAGILGLIGMIIKKVLSVSGADADKTNILLRSLGRSGTNTRFWRYLAGRLVSAVQNWDNENLATLLSQVGLRSVPIVEIVPEHKNLLLTVPTPRGEWDTPYDDLMTLGSLVKHFSPRRLLEIGTFNGIGTLSLIANSPQDARIVTLDIQEHDERIDFSSTPYGSRITALVADSSSCDLVPYAQDSDFIFVDADHRYDAVKNDSMKAFDLVAPGGIIVWHDYPFFPGVKRALDEIGQAHKIVHLQGTRIAFYRAPATI